MAKLIHNKKSNVGLIYDFLMQEIVESKVLNDENKRKAIVKIVKEYFYNNKYLNEEFNLFNILLRSEYKDKENAKRFVIECLHEAENLKNTIEERKQVKQRLLEDIYKVCNKETFFEHTLTNYNTYATINLLIDYYSKNKKINEIKYLIELENKLLEHIGNNKVIAKISMIYETKDLLTDLESEIVTINLKQNYFPKLKKEQAELIEYYASTYSDDIIVNKLDTAYRSNYNKLRNKYTTEAVDFTKNKLKEAMNILSERYKSSDNVEDKLKIILDSFEII